MHSRARCHASVAECGPLPRGSHLEKFLQPSPVSSNLSQCEWRSLLSDPSVYILLFLYFIRLTPIDSKGNELLVFSHDALDSSSSFCPPGTFKVFAPRVFCRKNSVQTNLEAPSQHKHHRLHRLCEVYQELVSQDKQRETSHIQTFDVFQHQVHAQGQYLVPHQGVFGVVSLQGHIALALLRAECTVI